MSNLPDRGRLAVLPLPDLLLLLHQQRVSGRLRLARDAITRDVDLRDGQPTRVKTIGLAPQLCTRLVASAQLSPEQAAKVNAQAPRFGHSEEKAILALRLLTPRALYLALRQQERDLLLDAFSWPDGTFELCVAAVHAEEASTPAHDPLELVHAGVSMHWGAERIVAALGSAAHRYPRLGPGSDTVCSQLQSLPGYAPLHAQLDGRSTLVDTVAAAKHAGAAALAFILHRLGGLALFEEPRGDTDEIPEAHSEPPSDLPEIEIEVAVTDHARDPRRGGADAGENAARAGDGGSGLAAAARRALLEQQRRLADADHYALLGLRRDADTATVRRAYTAAAKRYHPDALARLGLEDLREVANEVFARISEAHAVLADPVQRRDYDESLVGGGADEAQRHVSAEVFYRKAEVLLRKGSFADALQFLRPAVELCPDEAAYRSALGWALFKHATSDPESARAELERAVALDPKDPVVRERLGTVLRALGKGAEAAEQLARARELDNRASRSR